MIGTGYKYIISTIPQYDTLVVNIHSKHHAAGPIVYMSSGAGEKRSSIYLNSLLMSLCKFLPLRYKYDISCPNAFVKYFEPGSQAFYLWAVKKVSIVTRHSSHDQLMWLRFYCTVPPRELPTVRAFHTSLLNDDNKSKWYA